MRTTYLTSVGVTAALMIGGAPTFASQSSSTPLRSASTYVTFFILDGDTSDDTTLDPHLAADLEMALADKGLVAASPEDAEAVVVVHIATRARHSRTAFYAGWGGWGWRPADVRPGDENYTPGTLVVDMFDAWSKQLVWHGASSPLSKDPSAHATTKAVATIFRNFPEPNALRFARRRGPDREGLDASQRMQVFIATSPAVLVRIDGEPTYQDVPGTSLERITNTPAFILRDDAGMLYLRVGNRWLEAYDLTAPWSIAGMLPDGAERAFAQRAQDGKRDPLADWHGPVPEIYVSTTLAELIVTEGEPQFVPVQGASAPLLQVRNTTAPMFKEPTDHELYVRTSQGWFRSWTTRGPWQPVAATQLPSDLVARLQPSRAFTSPAQR